MTTDDFSFRVLDWAMVACGAVLGLLWKSQSDRIKEHYEQHTERADEIDKKHDAISGELRQVELLVAGEYVKRNEVKDLFGAVFTKLDKIEALLHTKVDK